MKKIITIILIALICIVPLTSCEGDKECTHEYDNDFDESCNICEESREISPCMYTDNFEINGAMMSYFANSYYQNWYSSNYYYIYLGYISFDVSIPLNEQYTDVTKTQTYYDYFKEATTVAVETYLKYCEAAKNDSEIDFSALEQKVQNRVDSAIKSIKESADANGMDLDTYLHHYFSEYIDESNLRKALSLEYIASEYYEMQYNKFYNSITAEELEEYYDVATMGEKDETLLRDMGHILFAVDDDSYKTLEEARSAALIVLNQLKQNETDGIVDRDIFKEFAEANTNDVNVFYDYVNKGDMIEPVDEWLFNANTVGEIGLVESEYGVHILYYDGETVPAWTLTTREKLTGEKMHNWYENLIVTVHKDIPECVFVN